MTATLERLEDEAERSGMKMGIAGSQRQYEPFTRSRAGEFVLKEGRTFSALERQRLVLSILEAEHNRLLWRRYTPHFDVIAHVRRSARLAALGLTSTSSLSAAY